MASLVREELRGMVRPGVLTRELDEYAERRLAGLGAKPAFKGYRDYPFTLCASVNDAVVHGFPSTRALQEGDILSLDMGAIVDGYYGDAAVTRTCESETAARGVHIATPIVP